MSSFYDGGFYRQRSQGGLYGPSSSAGGSPFGPSIIVNGSMDTDSAWSGSNWAIADGILTHTPGLTVGVSQSVAPSAGTRYRIRFSVVGRTAGAVLAGFIGGTTVNTPSVSGNGVHVFTVTALLGNSGFRFSPSSTFDGSIDDVSVQPVL